MKKEDVNQQIDNRDGNKIEKSRFTKIKSFFRKWLSKPPIFISLIVVILLALALLVVSLVNESKPVGVEEDIKVSDTSVLVRKHTQDVLLSDGSIKKTADQKYLSNVYVPPLDSESREFDMGESLFNNLIRLLESGAPEDINQAAALYEKNRQAYVFSSPKNKITAALGNDLIILDEYNYNVAGVNKANRGYFDKELGSKVLKNFNSPITIALVGSRLLPIAHSSFVIDGESNVMDRFLYQQSWYEGMYQYYPGDDLSTSHQPKKTEELFKEYKGRVLSVFEVRLTGKFSPDVDVLIFEDGNGKLFVYGFYYTESYNSKQTIDEYMNSEYSTFDNFKPDDLNWQNFQKGFNEIYNQNR